MIDERKTKIVQEHMSQGYQTAKLTLVIHLFFCHDYLEQK
jgi:hypothetical protein